MADAARARKLADRIKVVVAETLEMRVKDPRLGFITVTDARVTGDLQQATVFYTVFGDEPRRADTAAALESAEGCCAPRSGRQTGVRLTPTLDVRRRRRAGERRAHRGAAGPGRRGRRRGAPGGRGRDVRRGARPLPGAPRDDEDDDDRATMGTDGEADGTTGADECDDPDGLVVVDKPAGLTSHDVVAPGPPPRRHPQGRPRRHARPDGDRRAGAGGRPGDPAARSPGPDRQGLRRDDPAGRRHGHRRRRGRGRRHGRAADQRHRRRGAGAASPR